MYANGRFWEAKVRRLDRWDGHHERNTCFRDRTYESKPPGDLHSAYYFFNGRYSIRNNRTYANNDKESFLNSIFIKKGLLQIHMGPAGFEPATSAV
jgi:hypothetical protein